MQKTVNIKEKISSIGGNKNLKRHLSFHFCSDCIFRSNLGIITMIKRQYSQPTYHNDSFTVFFLN